MIDLHVHTTESDGGCSPREVVYLAHRKGLCALAITDHDTVVGVRETREEGQRRGIEIVPGVELNAKIETGILHILGYYVESENPWLQGCLEALRTDRHELFSDLLRELQESPITSGLETPDDRSAGGILAKTGKPVDRASLALDGDMEEMNDPLARLGVKRYSPRANVLIDQAVQLICAAGGVPVLAHPYSLIKYSSADWDSVLLRLINRGIQGIEVYYPAHTPAQTSMFLRSAREHGLVVTGGSDFHGRIHRIHGQIRNLDEIGRVPGWTLHYSLLEELKNRANANRSQSQVG